MVIILSILSWILSFTTLQGTLLRFYWQTLKFHEKFSWEFNDSNPKIEYFFALQFSLEFISNPPKLQFLELYYECLLDCFLNHPNTSQGVIIIILLLASRRFDTNMLYFFLLYSSLCLEISLGLYRESYLGLIPKPSWCFETILEYQLVSFRNRSGNISTITLGILLGLHSE